MGLSAAAGLVAADGSLVSLRLGRYCARIGQGADLRDAALEVRRRAFRGGCDDTDPFDIDSLHGIVETGLGQTSVAFRARLITRPDSLDQCYTGQFYGMGPLGSHPGPYLELGRFCQAEGMPDIMALQLAWAALGVLVDRHAVTLMIGCSSFPGADPDRHRAALALLRARHLGPEALRPTRTSPQAIDLPDGAADATQLPTLLRSYLGMGGWVSDHAVCDPDLDRLHVFTGLAIDAIPEARKARLRALAQSAQTGPLDLARAAP